MRKLRTKHSPELKAKVALAAIRGELTTNEIASQFEVHGNQVTKWKKQSLDELAGFFSDKRERHDRGQEELVDELYKQIGRLKVELDWLKKKTVLSVEEKRLLVEPENSQISILQQCRLLGLSRASLYYQPVGEDEYNLFLMRLLDEQFTATPFYGVPRMTAWFRNQGHSVNNKRIRRLMRVMGLEAIYPKPNLSRPAENHCIYPYLLRNVPVLRINQVWSL